VAPRTDTTRIRPALLAHLAETFPEAVAGGLSRNEAGKVLKSRWALDDAQRSTT